MSTISCPQCGTQNKSNAKFCAKCGVALPLPVAPPPRPPQPLPPAPQPRPQSPGPTSPPPATPAPRSQAAAPTQARPPITAAADSRKWLFITAGSLLTLLLALCIGGAVWWYFFSSPASLASTETVPPTAAAYVSPEPVEITPTTSQVEVVPPSPTAIPVETPVPVLFTSTPPPPTAIPTSAPTPTNESPSTPSPIVLFEDNFDTGIKSEWVLDNNASNLTGGQLVSSAPVTTQLPSDGSVWTDYRVSFDFAAGNNLTTLDLKMRWQDDQNYLVMKCAADSDGAPLSCDWHRFAGGQGTPIIATEFSLPQVGSVAVEAIGNKYRVVGTAGEQLKEFEDLVNTVASGGIVFSTTGQALYLDYFKVEALAQ